MSLKGPSNKNLMPIRYPSIKPKNIFLIDGIGAFVTAISLLIIYQFLNIYFLVPENVLLILIAIAILFSLYSFICFLFIKDNWKPFLFIISLANLLYCLLTILFMVLYFQSITLLAILYFSIEIIIIFALVSIELKTVKKRK